jgi:selenocysteine lyase/cysteine desulfurase
MLHERLFPGSVAECLADGADLVSFSTDKLFSGPQGGILAGREDLVARAASHPVARAVRPDKLQLAGLEAKDVDGALVGGASLDPDEFAKVVQFRHDAP